MVFAELAVAQLPCLGFVSICCAQTDSLWLQTKEALVTTVVRHSLKTKSLSVIQDHQGGLLLSKDRQTRARPCGCAQGHSTAAGSA